jgi:hyperosmotically inducible periplasmic protein
MNRDLTRQSLLAAALAATFALGACGEARNDAPRTSTATPPATTATTPADRTTADASAAANRAGDKMAAAGDKTAAKAGDAVTTAKVKSRLMAEPGIDSLQIDVDSASGRVTLTGEVDSPALKARAKELAGGIEGVTSVVDRMTVKNS